MNVTTVDEIESVVHIAFAARCDLHFEIAIAVSRRRMHARRCQTDVR